MINSPRKVLLEQIGGIRVGEGWGGVGMITDNEWSSQRELHRQKLT